VENDKYPTDKEHKYADDFIFCVGVKCKKANVWINEIFEKEDKTKQNENL
jgi:hypothetical protein